jgi:hypothetical protein
MLSKGVLYVFDRRFDRSLESPALFCGRTNRRTDSPFLSSWRIKGSIVWSAVSSHSSSPQARSPALYLWKCISLSYLLLSSCLRASLVPQCVLRDFVWYLTITQYVHFCKLCDLATANLLHLPLVYLSGSEGSSAPHPVLFFFVRS